MKATRSGVFYIDVSADREGQRIDNFLFAQIKNIPKSHIYKILRRGEIRVNQRRIKPNYKLRVGDRIRVPPIHIHIKQRDKANQALLEELDKRILFEDEQFMVMDKPAGLAVHLGSGLSTSLIDCLNTMYPQDSLYLAHRLDKWTSGCVMCAKSLPVLRKLQQGFKSGTILKQYICLVKGPWRVQDLQVDFKLIKSKLQGGERMTKTAAQGKAALSIFSMKRSWADASLMQIQLKTGRTHQIRVHSSEMGHPIAGDSKYGDKKFNQNIASLGLKRLFLHAEEIRLPKSIFGKSYRFHSQLPEDLRACLSKLNSL